jgi:hypothetical protein
MVKKAVYVPVFLLSIHGLHLTCIIVKSKLQNGCQGEG